MAKSVLKIGLLVILIAVALFVLIQFIPVGKNEPNPSVIQEPQWDSPQTRAYAQRACYDCHSNETVWPLYSKIAPVSWLVARDVNEGRQKLNFSEWGSKRQESDDIVKVVQEGEMPPRIYLPLHPSANLSAAEKQAFIEGLIKTFGAGDGESEKDH